MRKSLKAPILPLCWRRDRSEKTAWALILAVTAAAFLCGILVSAALDTEGAHSWATRGIMAGVLAAHPVIAGRHVHHHLLRHRERTHGNVPQRHQEDHGRMAQLGGGSAPGGRALPEDQTKRGHHRHIRPGRHARMQRRGNPRRHGRHGRLQVPRETRAGPRTGPEKGGRDSPQTGQEKREGAKEGDAAGTANRQENGQGGPGAGGTVQDHGQAQPGHRGTGPGRSAAMNQNGKSRKEPKSPKTKQEKPSSA